MERRILKMWHLEGPDQLESFEQHPLWKDYSPRLQEKVQISKYFKISIYSVLPQLRNLDKIIEVSHPEEYFWTCGTDISFFPFFATKTTPFSSDFYVRRTRYQGKSIDRQNVEEGEGSPPERQQDSDTTRNKMRCSQGVAMIFEDAFVVFTRFLSLRSRGCALLETHRQRETTGIKKLYNSFFVMF
ncbi:hypothetical protein ACFW04_010169 [Cataglyphis niger]